MQKQQIRPGLIIPITSNRHSASYHQFTALNHSRDVDSNGTFRFPATSFRRFQRISTRRSTSCDGQSVGFLIGMAVTPRCAISNDEVPRRLRSHSRRCRFSDCAANLNSPTSRFPGFSSSWQPRFDHPAGKNHNGTVVQVVRRVISALTLTNRLNHVADPIAGTQPSSGSTAPTGNAPQTARMQLPRYRRVSTSANDDCDPRLP
jgi:hypothetical protein